MGDEERFWSRVQINEPGECWWWQTCRTQTGYGKTWFRNELWYAHRVAWTLTYGEIPEGLCVCHQCDEPGCVNPYHLFLGTDADNVADMIAKERQARGEQNGSAKLTESEVLEIRGLWAETELLQREIAKLFGVKRQTIGDIVNGRTWEWLNQEGLEADPDCEPGPEPGPRPSQRERGADYYQASLTLAGIVSKLAGENADLHHQWAEALAVIEQGEQTG